MPVRHVLKVNGYGGRQAKGNEKRQCFKGWETLVKPTTYKVTQRGGEHGGEGRQYHGGAEGTKSDRGVVYVLLIALVKNVLRNLANPLLCNEVDKKH